MRRQFNRQRKEFQVYLHKTNLMMWIGHGNYVNPILNNTSLMQQCLALLPKNNNHCYPKEKTDTKYFKQISEWFKSQISLNNREMYCKLQKRPPLLTSLALQIKTKQAICRRDFVLIFIILLRAIGIQCRMVLNLNFAPLRPPQSDLLSLSTKEQSKKKDKDDEGSISKYKKYSSSGSSKNSKDSKSTSKSSKDSSNSASKSNSKPKMKSQSNKENIADQPSFISPKIASRTRSKSRQNLEAIPQMDGVDDIPKKPTKSLRIKALKEFDVSIDQSYVKLSPDENPAKASTSGREPVASKRTKKVEAPSSAKKMRSRSKSGTRKEAPAKSDSFKENSTPGKSSEKVAIPKLANLRNMARKSVHFSASTEEREINGQNPESAEKPKEKIAVEETEKPKEKSKVPEKSSKIEKPLESDESSKKSSKFSKLKQYKKSEPEKSMSPEKPKESTKSEKPGSSRKTVEKKSDDSKSEKPGSSRKKVEKKSEDSKVEKPGSSRKKVEKKSDDSKAERPSSSRKPSERLEKKKEPEKSTSSEKKAQKRSTSSAQKEVEAKKRKANSKSKPKVLEIEYMDDSGSSDEEYDKAQKAKAKKTVKNDHRDRRVLSTDLDESIDASDKQGKSKKMGIDIWVELYSEADEKWIPVDVFKGKVGAVPEICKAASHPITYVLAWNNDNSVKDVSAKYCSNFNTTTRKLRVEPSYLESILKHFKGRVTARDRKEDDEIAQQMADQELPTSVQDYKNHPLYALKRHLLKFEAIYPPDVPTLGFIREEPIYPRDAVFTLHSREIWVKQAKVVKPFEQPYKIVTARPKWDRATKSVIKDIPLELFGVWQTQEYEPPTAENGVVPRNAYGNVELFKPTMLPKKTVHIQLPGLNKVCKKLNIDCAQVVLKQD
jgi:xeroderma pigmentosum group C-complementing protein